MDTTIAASCSVGTEFYHVTEMGTFLYDRQGLQYVILERKQQGLCAAAMEEALTHMNHVQEQSSLSLGSD